MSGKEMSFKQTKVLTIIGTRPEAIKLAPVVMALNGQSDHFVSRVCVTAQHRQLLDQVMVWFDIQADHDLDIMTPGQSLAQVTARGVEKLSQVIATERPDVVLVQGDTSTTFCGALAAYYQKVPVGHVEAGLRTGNKYAPYPEEINRCLVSQLADYHFAATEQAGQTLIREGIPPSDVFITGNTVIDAVLWVREQVQTTRPELPPGLVEAIDGQSMILVTGHRRESFGAGFENIYRAIREVADTLSEVVFIYPVHLNPNVREPVNRILGGHERIHLTEPLAYGPFVWLMDRATIVLTDSGGVQEEAPALGKPVLVMREITERPEGIKAGNARLIGVQQKRIVDELLQLLQQPERRTTMTKIKNPYGDGQAAAKIVEILTQI
jgi:UDP-N-acetylglucosamine 2-epimerase (non-hydrolysing)